MIALPVSDWTRCLRRLPLFILRSVCLCWLSSCLHCRWDFRCLIFLACCWQDSTRMLPWLAGRYQSCFSSCSRPTPHRIQVTCREAAKFLRSRHRRARSVFRKWEPLVACIPNQILSTCTNRSRRGSFLTAWEILAHRSRCFRNVTCSCSSAHHCCLMRQRLTRFDKISRRVGLRWNRHPLPF